MIYVLFGKSGAGKDAVLKGLVECGYIPIVSTTSRPIRENERPGIDYYFVTREKFESMIENNELIEYRSYNTLVDNIPDIWYYGVAKQEFDPNKNYVTVLDVTGLASFIDEYGQENITSCYIDVSDKTREERAKLRGSFNKTEWDRRVIDDNFKFSKRNVDALATYIVENENRSLESLISEIKHLFSTHEN